MAVKTVAPAHEKGQRVGYIRVSTFDQNMEMQIGGVFFDRASGDRVLGRNINDDLLIDALTHSVLEGFLKQNYYEPFSRTEKSLNAVLPPTTD